MSAETLGGLTIVGLVVLLAIRIPVGAAMFIAGVGGYLALASPAAVVHVLGSTLLQVSTEYTLSVLPLFVLMGSVALRAGMSERIFAASTALFGSVRGAEAMATVAASAAFSTVSGSSLATTATISRIAAPSLRLRGYDDRLISGSIAAGGTLGILIPPSVMLVIYALITGESIVALFAAAILPGLVMTVLYVLTVWLLIKRWPQLAPEAPVFSGNRLASVAKGWEVLVLFVLTIGGIYAGWYTPTEAAAIGATTAALMGFATGTLTVSRLTSAVREAILTTTMVFFVVLGATFYSYFIVQAQFPAMLLSMIDTMALPPVAVILGIIVFYLVAGCFLDGIGMMLATVPVFYPVVVGLGYDPIWFGVLLVILVEVGLVTPPVGMNLFVIKSQVPDLRLTSLYLGILPFLAAQLLMLAMLTAMPSIATWLPEMLSR